MRYKPIGMTNSSDTIGLGALEARLYSRRFDHGLLDLAIGLGVLLIGFDLWYGDSYAFVLYWVLVISLGRLRVQPWLERRGGRVRWAEERRDREASVRRALAIAMAITLVLGVAAFFLVEPGQGGPRARVLFGLFAGGVLAGAGSVMSVRRLWLWGGMVAAAFLVGAALGGREVIPYYVMGTGGAISLLGLAGFLRFLARTRPEGDPA